MILNIGLPVVLFCFLFSLSYQLCGKWKISLFWAVITASLMFAVLFFQPDPARLRAEPPARPPIQRTISPAVSLRTLGVLFYKKSKLC